jgi:hypothetical protein
VIVPSGASSLLSVSVCEPTMALEPHAWADGDDATTPRQAIGSTTAAASASLVVLIRGTKAGMGVLLG